MHVREYMTTKVITCTPDTLVWDAQKMMLDHNIRRLPVMKGSKLVGIITFKDILQATPFSDTSLMVSELNYFLSRLKVERLMTKNVITVTPDTPVEDAVFLGQEHGIGTLPVMEAGKLVGIITATDLYKLVVQALSFGKPGVRLHISGVTEGRQMRELIEVILSHQATIWSILKVVPPATGKTDVIIRLDPIQTRGLLKDLSSRGYAVEVRRK